MIRAVTLIVILGSLLSVCSAEASSISRATPAHHAGLAEAKPTVASGLRGNAIWSGYELSGHQATSVSGAWTVPAIDTSTTYRPSAQSMWVGLGGDPQPLLQIGTKQTVDGSGNTSYRGFWELANCSCPQEQPLPNVSVHIGDRMVASVRLSNTGVFPNIYTLTLRDITNGTSQQVTSPYNSTTPTTAEWILEAPQDNVCQSPAPCKLAKYTETAFDSMVVNGVDPGLLGLSNATSQLGIVQGNLVSTPSDLSHEDDAFNLQYGGLQPSPPSSNPHHRIATARNPNGALEIFLVGENDNLYTATETSVNGPFGGWVALGTPPNVAWPNGEAVTVGTNKDGRLELFMVGSDGQLYHDYQTAPGGPNWSGWSQFGVILSNMDSLAVQFDKTTGHLSLFYLGLDGHCTASDGSPLPCGRLYAKTQNPNATHGWGAPQQIGSASFLYPVYDTIGSGVNTDGRIEVFLAGLNNTLYHIYQVAPGSTTWSAPGPFSGIVIPHDADIPVGRNSPDRRLEVFVVAASSELIEHNYQKASNGTTGWSGWSQLSSTTDSAPHPPLSVTLDAHGHLNLFLIRQDNNIWLNYQLASGWHGWTPFTGQAVEPYWDAIGVGQDADGAINTFFVNQSDHKLYTVYQNSAGTWLSASLGGAWFD